MVGELDAVRILLRHGAFVDSRTGDGWTALQLASGNGHLDIVRMLLGHGATVDSHHNRGWTASGGKSFHLSRCFSTYD